MPTFHLILRTPDKVLHDGPATRLSAHAADGSIGILAGHTPLLTALDVGIVRASVDGRELMWAAGDSLMNVRPDRVEILTDYAIAVPDATEAARRLETVREWYRASRYTPVADGGPAARG